MKIKLIDHAPKLPPGHAAELIALEFLGKGAKFLGGNTKGFDLIGDTARPGAGPSVVAVTVTRPAHWSAGPLPGAAGPCGGSDRGAGR
jgi:hypothetical protein